MACRTTTTGNPNRPVGISFDAARRPRRQRFYRTKGLQPGGPMKLLSYWRVLNNEGSCDEPEPPVDRIVARPPGFAGAAAPQEGRVTGCPPAQAAHQPHACCLREMSYPRR